MANKRREVLKVDEETSVVNNLCSLIEKSAEESIGTKDSFIIAVSGGSVVSMLVKGLPKIKTSWPKWRVIFCDERLVPVSDKESTFGLYKEALLPVIPLQEQQFISINFSFADEPISGASEASLDYEKKLKELFPQQSLLEISGKHYPRLDCAILGMGPDGHTCSLFPGATESLAAKTWVIPITNSPKPPPCRVSLTLPVLNSARVAIFPITGASKASMIKSILEDDADLPANMVRPIEGIVYWILDKAAASQLKSH